MTELIAYLDDNNEWTAQDLPVNDLTCINYAFAKFDGLKIIPTLKKIDLVNQIKAAHPHLRTLISVGGWGTDGFSDAVATPSNRHTVVQNLIQYMQHYHFDGVDIDWEYPGDSTAGIKSSPDDAQHFLRFCQELRTALDDAATVTGHRRYWLTVATGASERLLNLMSPTEQFTYVRYVDFLNVMTYDMRGSWTSKASHHTNLLPYATPDGRLSVASAVETLLAHDVPASKIVIGAAFYSRDWFGFPADVTGASVLNMPSDTLGTHTTDYRVLHQLITQHPENVYWDERAQAPYYFDGHRFSSYDDPRSMAAKAQYVLHQNLRGLMYWESSLDCSNSLAKAAAHVLFPQS